MPFGVRSLIDRVAAAHAQAAPDGRQAVLIGLVGRGIGSSRSPMMHQREGERLGLRCTYALLDFDREDLPDEALPEVLAAAEAAGFAGLNVTHPYKQAVLRHLTTLAPEAIAIGAVNTVVLARGHRAGHNTDSWGFAESFRHGLAGAPLKAVLQFGAGGGGAAVAHALLGLGVEDLDIYDKDDAKAVALADILSSRFGRTVVAVTDPVSALARAGGVVNASPIGMDKYPGAPFPLEALTARHWVADIVYFPAETALLRHARAIGCRTLPGTGMAVYQAVKAFELFTGIVPDRDAMTRHFEAA